MRSRTSSSCVVSALPESSRYDINLDRKRRLQTRRQCRSHLPRYLTIGLIALGNASLVDAGYESSRGVLLVSDVSGGLSRVSPGLGGQPICPSFPTFAQSCSSSSPKTLLDSLQLASIGIFALLSTSVPRGPCHAFGIIPMSGE